MALREGYPKREAFDSVSSLPARNIAAFERVGTHLPGDHLLSASPHPEVGPGAYIRKSRSKKGNPWDSWIAPPSTA
jgi:hypothetical protein